MAADSSSSDDEELKKCQEAVWDTQILKAKDADSNMKESKRVVSEHDHDGNELQVTQGFRKHVAKKLGHYLDSCFSETHPKSSNCPALTNCDDGDDDGGFRLFSTSIPGQKVNEPPRPVRRRPVPSSSDSDSEREMMLREAAVSLEDLVPASALVSSTEFLGLEKTKKNAAKAEDNPKKKKKRKKPNNKDGEQNSACNSKQSNSLVSR